LFDKSKATYDSERGDMSYGRKLCLTLVFTPIGTLFQAALVRIAMQQATPAKWSPSMKKMPLVLVGAFQFRSGPARRGSEKMRSHGDEEDAAYRVEFYKAWNTTHFGPPNTTMTSTNFGRVTGTLAGGRSARDSAGDAHFVLNFSKEVAG
jgi:hypothetical protein